MKKIILFFISLFSVVSMEGQSGDGLTPSTAYYGIISTSQTWPLSFNGGVVYVGQLGNEDLTIGTGGSLSIEAGVTVKFCTTGSDLIISGNGYLSAVGNSSSPITFTNNIQASWGHISFEGSTGSSILDYCIIENGLKSGTGVDAYGGGIHINTSSLTISHCQVHNNTAAYGGGIFVNQSVNPTISNCQIYSNTATAAGGGFYFWDNSYCTISNCNIYNNNSTGSSGGGGVFLGPNVNKTWFYNCVIFSNTSTSNLGNNILLYLNSGTDKPRFYNTIIWGTSSNSINYSAQITSINDFNNCAIQGYTSGYTNCINLSGTNNDPNGPNFYNVTVGSEDFEIQYISPCRDAGTSSGAPLTDYLGNSRIGPTDIGAYEDQYNTWKTTAASTDWATAGNWELGVPTASQDIIIPTGATNYPTGSVQSFVILANKCMILNPGAEATFDNLRISGGATLRLESDASGISSLIINSISGTATIDLFLTGGNPGAPTLKLNKWHFISSPVSSLLVSTFAPIYTQNVVGWYDDQVSATLASGWVGYDGYRYATGAMGGPTFDHLSPGSGYDYYAATDQKYTFSGSLNVSDLGMSLSYAVDDALHGFNLLGNPFSSGLDWNYILNNTSPSYPANTSKSLYFTRDNAQCSYIGGVGIPSDVTGIIPPMQGFFVKTYSTGNTITIPAAARVQGGIHARYKGLEIIPLVRLSLAESILTDETVVRFDSNAKPSLDYDFDATKMFLSPDILSIYSTSEGSNFAINGLPFPDTLVTVPIIVNLTASGSHTITATQLQGLDNYNVTLTDKTTGLVMNLKTTPLLTFSVDAAGTIADRFILKVANINTGIENPVVAKFTFNIYPSNNMINIQTLSDKWDGETGTVNVLDLTGRMIENLNNSMFSKNSPIQVPSPAAKGIYIVELKSGVMRYVGKVVIR